MSVNAVAYQIRDAYALSQKAQIVIEFLARVADNKTHESFYSQKTMAKRLNMSYSSIQRAIRELKTIGVLIIKPGYDMDRNGRQTSNLYTIISEEELKDLILEEKKKTVRENVVTSRSKTVTEPEKCPDILEQTTITTIPVRERQMRRYERIRNHGVKGFPYMAEIETKSRRRPHRRRFGILKMMTNLKYFRYRKTLLEPLTRGRWSI